MLIFDLKVARELTDLMFSGSRFHNLMADGWNEYKLRLVLDLGMSKFMLALRVLLFVFMVNSSVGVWHIWLFAL